MTHLPHVWSQLVSIESNRRKSGSNKVRTNSADPYPTLANKLHTDLVTAGLVDADLLDPPVDDGAATATGTVAPEKRPSMVSIEGLGGEDDCRSSRIIFQSE